MAFAQNPTSDGNQVAGAEPEQNTTQVQQAKVERTLQGAGFTDTEIMPTAFLVRAKNPDGKRVLMVVDPLSLTANQHQTTQPPEGLVRSSLEGFRTDITEQQLRGAPAYSRDRNYDWSDRNRERELHSHYGARPYWEP